MRLLGRLLLVVLLALAGLLGWRAYDWEGLAQRHAGQSLGDYPVEARPTTVHPLDSRDWTRFAIEAGGERLRVLSNVDLPASDASAESEQTWRYAIAYRLLDEEARLLHQAVHHHRTRVTRYQAPDGRHYTSATYYPPGDQPTDGRAFQVDLARFPGAAFLELRAAELPAPLQRAVVRAFQFQARDEREVAYQWQRLSTSSREALAEASVYPATLLAGREQANLVRRHWSRIGPTGVVDRDYRSETLYLLDRDEGQAVEEPLPPPGRRVEPLRPLMMEVPARGRLRLEFDPTPAATGAQPTGAQAAAILRWFGRPASRQQDWRLDLEEGTTPWSAELDPGMVELTAERPGVVRAWWRAEEGEPEVEVTPEPVRLRAYLADRNAPLEYRIATLDGVATPLRVDLRALPALDGPGQVGIDLLDRLGQTVETLTLELASGASRYDALADAPGLLLGEPQRRYLVVPPSVVGVRVTADAPTAVALFTRPPDLARASGYGTAAADSGILPPTWYPLRPPRHAELHAVERAPLLELQRRPAELDEQIAAGRYRWRAFLPVGGWRARHLLTPVAAGLPEREESLDSRYAAIVGERVFTFPDPFAAGAVRPRLLYHRDASGPASLRVWIDGVLHHEERILARDGEFELPPLTPGRHRIRVEGDGRHYINRVAGGDWLKRFALRLTSHGLQFHYPHPGGPARPLALRYHGAHGRHEVDEVVVSIDGPTSRGTGPYSSWTPRVQRFLYGPPDGGAVAVLGSPGERVDAGALGFITLGEDLPAGTYRLRVTPVAGREGYVILSRTEPGLFRRGEYFHSR